MTDPETWVHIPALGQVAVSFEHKYITSQESSQVKGYSAVQQLLLKTFWKDFLSSVLNWGFQPLEEWSSRKAFWEEQLDHKVHLFQSSALKQ